MGWGGLGGLGRLDGKDLGMDLGWIWDGFGMDLGWILDGFWMDFGADLGGPGKMGRFVKENIFILGTFFSFVGGGLADWGRRRRRRRTN